MRLFRRLPVLDPRYAGFAHRPSGFPDPATATDGTVGYGAPHFASQIGAAQALKDRLYPNVVPLHASEDTTGGDAA